MVNGGTYSYEYHLKDHLGNTRVAYSDANSDGFIDEDEILQVNDYYPFGMKHEIEGYPNHANQKYLYNGKELQEETGWYDYGTRMYDASLGRWHNFDPLEQFMSPYLYAGNNPVNVIDPSGMWASAVNADAMGWLTDEEMGGNNAKSDNANTNNLNTSFENNSFFTTNGESSENEDKESSGEKKTSGKDKKEGDAANGGDSKGITDGVNYVAGAKATGASILIDARLTRLSPYRPLTTTGGRTIASGTSLHRSTLKLSQGVKGFGFGLSGLGVLYDYTYGIQRYNAYGADDPWAVSPQKANVNTGVTAWSVFVNPAIGLLYFGIDGFYPGGWPEAMRIQTELRESHREFWGDRYAPEVFGKF